MPRLAFEKVAIYLGTDVTRLVGVWLDLLAQTINHILDQGCISLSIEAPDALDDLIAGERLVGMIHQQVQNAEFKIGEPYFSSLIVE